MEMNEQHEESQRPAPPGAPPEPMPPGSPRPGSPPPGGSVGSSPPGGPAESSLPEPYSGAGTDVPYGDAASAGGYGGPYGPGDTRHYGPAPAPAPDPYGGGPARATNAGKIVLVVVAVLILMGGSAVLGGIVGGFATQQFRGQPAEVTRVVDAPQLDYTSLASIASDVSPSVVSIRIQPNGQGSGVVLDGEGHILTNAHVVENASGNQVRVSFSNGEVAPATIVGADARSDVAVVKVDGVEGLTPAKFGDSGELLVGDTVLAIGSPLGFEGTVTQGIISALDRTLQPGEPGEPSLSGLLQTDASINPGNSGGALVNMNGEVIGVNTAIATTGQSAQERGFLGVGFAVPSNRALAVARALIAGDDVRHPFLGVEIATAADGGALVGRVQPGSPADEAGIQAGDIIVRLDDRPINDSSDLVSAVQSTEVGDTVELELVREGETTTARVTLGEVEN